MLSKFKKEKIVKYAMLFVLAVVILVYVIICHDSIVEQLENNFGKDGSVKKIFEGLLNTIIITISAFIIGLILGFITCLIEGLSSKKTGVLILKNIFSAYVSIFRGTPMMVQLLIIYYIVFNSFTGNTIFIAIFAFGLNSGAYVSEIIRGGINAVPVGQMEAGRSLGLPYSVVMRKIIFPQAIRNSLPSLGNEFITLIKETSVAGFIGAFDLTLAFRKLANATYEYTTVYLIMGISYFVIVLVITKLLSMLERRVLNRVRTE